MMTTKQKLSNLAEVECVEKEDSGIVVYTDDGYCWEEDGCHTRFFDTYKEAWDSRDLIRKCSGEQGCCVITGDVTAGEKVDCFWGQWRVNAKVSKVSKRGNVYARRWNKKRKCWTTERQIEPYKGMWRLK